MQLQFPIFPSNTKLINECLGVFEKDGTVYYLHNGSPILCHEVGLLNQYRFITANLVVSGLCTPSQLSKALGVNAVNFQRYAKNLREKGSEWFFNRKDDRGKCYKLNDESFKLAQEMLDQGYSIGIIAKRFGVTYGALKHHITNGKLKKKLKIQEQCIDQK